MTDQFQLTDDQRAIQDMARKFTADAITPFAAEWDEKAHSPRDVIKQAAELGFAAIYVSEESGGIGLGRLEAALIMEAMSYGCPATSAFISIHNMASWMIDSFGGAAVKAKYLPDLVTMDRMASYCLTEPGSGSDAAALKTTATLDGDHYVVNGTKQFISGAGVNDLYVTMVRTGQPGPKGISCLVIEKDMPGVSFGAKERKLGWNASPTAQVIFDNVKVPVENLVGEEGKGFRYILSGMNAERILIASECVGDAKWFIDKASAYAKERKLFNRPIGQNQGVQFPIARCYMQMRAAELMVHEAARRYEAGEDCGEQANMAKMLAAEASWAAAEACVQTHGGFAFAEEYDVERKFRETRLYQVAPISTNLVLSYVAEHVLGMPRSY